MSRPTSPARPADGLVSQGIAAAIFVAWLTIHFYGIFAQPLSSWPILLLVPTLLIQTWLSVGLFIVAHDCMHGALAPGNPGLNRLIGRVALMTYAGLDYDRTCPAHYDHHRHTGTANDPDFDVANPRRPVRWFVNFFLNYYTHIQIVRITIAACVYMLLGANLLNIVVFWAVPALLAAVQLFFFGTYLPHRQADAEFVDRHRARSVGPGGLVSLLGCFHFGGYHHEHHLHPATPWWRLPSTRKELR